MSYEKGFLKNFAKFTGKHLCQSLFLNKVLGVSRAEHLRATGFVSTDYAISDFKLYYNYNIQTNEVKLFRIYVIWQNAFHYHMFRWRSANTMAWYTNLKIYYFWKSIGDWVPLKISDQLYFVRLPEEWRMLHQEWGMFILKKVTFRTSSKRLT